ncbi:hypothetical protein OG523_01055 [Streptomyces virginiae]|uniref:hypothetical protein n=1 Tax=Streptomyces virginiae TaxID=1961 RepID=UPI002E2F5ECB|nr:hypothetical protein [Streptomyces virginiae]
MVRPDRRRTRGRRTPSLRELSARYGRAQAYYYGAQGDGSAWVVAENGVVIRRYSETGDGDDHLLTIGGPLPYERDRRVELGLAPDWDAAHASEDEEDEWKWAVFDMAPALAQAIGLSPLTIGSDHPDARNGGTGPH